MVGEWVGNGGEERAERQIVASGCRGRDPSERENPSRWSEGKSE